MKCRTLYMGRHSSHLVPWKTGPGDEILFGLQPKNPGYCVLQRFKVTVMKYMNTVLINNLSSSYCGFLFCDTLSERHHFGGSYCPHLLHFPPKLCYLPARRQYGVTSHETKIWFFTDVKTSNLTRIINLLTYSHWNKTVTPTNSWDCISLIG
jgi:hypothetical protein